MGDVVTSDFGEDVSFQIAHNGRVDPFRVYCQVKTFQKLPARVSLRAAHVRKWLLHLEPVLLVVFDRANRRLIGAPLSDLFEFYFFPDDRKVVSVETSALRDLNADELQKIAWDSRARIFDHIARDFFRKTGEYVSFYADGRISRGDETFIARQMSELWALKWFLEYLGLVEEHNGRLRRPRKGAMQSLKERIDTRLAGKQVGLRRVGLKQGLSIRALCVLTVIGNWNELTGLGMPTFLAERCGLWMEFLLVSEFAEGGVSLKRLSSMKII